MKKSINNIEIFNSETITVITHDGLCHSDDTLSVALITLLAEKLGKHYKVIRTRNWDEVPDEAIVIDVFGTSLDHHQMEEVIEGGRALASIGKTWRWAKTLVMSVFELDEKSWSSVDQNLFSAVDTTDNTGVMNPWNYTFNAFRSANGGLKAWEACLEYCRQCLSVVLKQEKNISRNRIEFEKIPVREIFNRKFKVSDHFIGCDPSESRFYGIVFPSQKEGWLTVRLLGGNTFSKKGVSSGEIPGVGFTHKGGWIGEIRSLEDLEKIL